jgi:protein-ribulosamine 3-kinase
MISQVPSSVVEGIQKILNLSDPSFIQEFSFSGGGCINNGGKIRTASGIFFLKWNDEKKFPGMFAAEHKGLQLLGEQNKIRIPNVVGDGTQGSHQFLLLEFIDQKSKSKNYWELVGTRLALLHQTTHKEFGLDHDNYIGSLRQFNRSTARWIDFFIHERLNVQLQLAIDNGIAPTGWRKKFESLYLKLPELVPSEPPSLLHGDLWSGNLITDERGEPCLIDPAVYFGNREADLAMTRLFGGFSEVFYSTYQDAFPLAPGFEERIDLYNLYPLLVHVNLFGGSYVHSVDSIVTGLN